jgi:hypothetical protein
MRDLQDSSDDVHNRFFCEKKKKKKTIAITEEGRRRTLSECQNVARSARTGGRQAAVCVRKAPARVLLLVSDDRHVLGYHCIQEMSGIYTEPQVNSPENGRSPGLIGE